MTQKKEALVFPGTEITTEEQYAPGANTISEKGIIKATTIGRVEFDDELKEVRVLGKTLAGLSIGDLVYGKVIMVKESSAIIEMKSAENGKKIMSPSAMLPVRSISTQYVSDVHALIKVGDLVKAKIARIGPMGTDLYTNETGLGVFKAYCSNCRSLLEHSNDKLTCLSCGNTEERRWFETVETEREFRPRENFGERHSEGHEHGSFGGGRRDFGERRPFHNRNGPRRDFNNRGGFGRDNGRGNFNKGF